MIPSLIGSVAEATRNGLSDSDRRLGQMLIANDMITQEELDEAIKRQTQSRVKGRIGAILLDMGVVTQEELGTIASEQADSVGLPPMPDSASSYAVRIGHVVYVMAGQEGSSALLSWRQHVRHRVGDLIEVKTCDSEEWARLKREAATGERRSDLVKHKAVRRAKTMFLDAARRNASDIHLTLQKDDDGEGSVLVQYRLNGSLIRMPDMPLAHGEPMFRALFQSMATVKDANVMETDDQHAVISDHSLLSDSTRDNQVSLAGIRLARSPIVHGQCMALRLLYNHKSDAKGNDRLTTLGYSRRHLRTYAHLARLKMGINLLTGPTGSGKSTTLFAQINAIVDTRDGIRVITMEDPIEHEFNHPRIWQYRMANANSDEAKAALFEKKLKTALREDPDLVMVGEIRGLEVAQEAINASITGHPVWSTLHAADPFMIVPRLVGMGVDRFMLGDPSVLSSFTAQRLVKTVCPHCEQVLMGDPRAILPENEARALEAWAELSTFGSFSGVRLRGTGRVTGVDAGPNGDKNICPHCRGTGEGPRTVIAQVLLTDEELLRDALDEGAAVARRKYMAREDAEVGMMAHGCLKVLSGRIDPRDLVEALGPLTAPPQEHRKLTEDDL
ncbi:MAG: ATPase, T2SS/T4P/T4SS family [Betaproteobacteria bacterium]|nr:ATPase, T2SS/T4P/T4SS family [Betaproteobacteria bacterium]